jgi:beta-phosphoglucomutase
MDEAWILGQSDYNPKKIPELETLFSLANGYFGIRGYFTERDTSYHPGVFVNGFYETSPICYGEKAYGFAEHNQTMIDVPDARYMEIFSGSHRFSLNSGTVRRFKRILDMKTGLLSREIVWDSPDGDRLTMSWEHLVSYRYLRIGGTRLKITHQGTHPVKVVSGIAVPSAADPAAGPHNGFDPRTAAHGAKAALMQVSTTTEQLGAYHTVQVHNRTAKSDLSLIFGYAVKSDGAGEWAYSENNSEEAALQTCTLISPVPQSEVSAELVVEKLFFYAFRPAGEEDALYYEFRTAMIQGIELGFEKLAEIQQEELSQFWQDADVQITGDPEYQKALRYNIFQLYQSAGRTGETSLSAKGLSGNGYEGHYFWDTEIYAMPFFTNASPRIARSLLKYRISILDHARSQARLLSEKGALYPWRTINGYEASAYFPAGTAQYHINADIAYSLMQYVEITGDIEIMLEGGAEMLFETARLWLSIGFFNKRKNGQFCINEVTGPDEYSALVNNNFYTNAMAAYHLGKADFWYRQLKESYPDFLNKLCSRLLLTEEEPPLWGKAAESMFFPYDSHLGIHPQDDTFLDREPWDFASTPPEKYPLLLHYHPLVIYRHQVLKQADTILVHLLLHDQFPLQQKIRDFNYYEPLTTGDSSLSACMQGIMALELGSSDTGIRYARAAAFVDLENLQGNTKDGLHTASMAGSWMMMLYGFAGVRYHNGIPSIYPHAFPGHWKTLSFKLKTAKGSLTVHIDRQTTTYQLLEEPDSFGDEQISTERDREKVSLELLHRGRPLKIGKKLTAVPTGPEFRGAVFDLDGVITSTDMYHYDAWKQLADEQNWKFDHSVNQRLRGVSRRESLMIILDENDVELDEKQILTLMERKNLQYRDSLAKLSADDLLPGTRELLTQLKKRGIRIAVASASRNADYIIRQLDLIHLLDYIVPVGEVEHGKPDPEIFIRAAAGIGCLPDECAGFEDAPPGIAGIQAAGMKSIGIGNAVSTLACDILADDLAGITVDQLVSLFAAE